MSRNQHNLGQRQASFDIKSESKNSDRLKSFMKLSRCETVQDIKPLNKNSKGMHIGHDGQTLKPSIKSLEERQRSLGFFSRQMVSVGTD